MERLTNLGGIAVDFTKNEDGGYNTAIGMKLRMVPRQMVADAVTSLILKMVETDPEFPELQEKALAKYINGENKLEETK